MLNGMIRKMKTGTAVFGNSDLRKGQTALIQDISFPFHKRYSAEGVEIVTVSCVKSYLSNNFLCVIMRANSYNPSISRTHSIQPIESNKVSYTFEDLNSCFSLQRLSIIRILKFLIYTQNQPIHVLSDLVVQYVDGVV